MGKAFHDLEKCHSKLKRKVLKKDRMKEARTAIKQYSKNFWTFTDELLSDTKYKDTQPSFSEDEGHQFFSNTYSTANGKNFSKPTWMHDVPIPSTPFKHDPITHDEITSVLKRCHCGSSPNPLDGVPYTTVSIPASCSAASLQHVLDV